MSGIPLTDLINGIFECFGAVFVWLGIMKLRKDKEVKGVHWLTILFFTVWGYWNCYFYPALDQWLSFAGGLAIALSNTIYVSMLIHYSRKNKQVS